MDIITRSVLEQRFTDNIAIKDDKLVLKYIPNETFSIPSLKMPLHNNAALEVFHYYNTIEIPDDDPIIKVFDAIDTRGGDNYRNTEELFKACIDAGIKDVVQYSGWLLVGMQIPVHHSFILYKGQHILDFSNQMTAEECLELANITDPFQAKRELESFYERKFKMKNSERQGSEFGRANYLYTYMAAPCPASEGKREYESLLKTYPNHITSVNVGQILSMF